MAKFTLRSRDLRPLGYTDGPAMGLALDLLRRHYKRLPVEQSLDLLRQVMAAPADFYQHEHFAPLAQLLAPPTQAVTEVAAEARYFATFGADNIGQEAVHQMFAAMKLPISVAGALMPDAHGGYGLPIGGVLATDNAVIPYGVGVDIGCRMCLSVFDLPGTVCDTELDRLQKAILDYTVFGPGGEFAKNKWHDHPVMQEIEDLKLPLVQQLAPKAFRQLGTSGGGNHFVEFGILEIPANDSMPTANGPLPLPTGTYLALLSHSGSRGFGAQIAHFYTNLAMKQSHLPDNLRQLAWLDLHSEAGQEYWAAMTVAGNYATGCHDLIHQRVAKAIGQRAVVKIENHHNFAWREQHEGREVIVHRKGATPAGKGVLGIIPGSMATPGYVVAGRGETSSLHSAAHGAGRRFSRGEAKRSFTPKMVRDVLKERGVTLLGGGVDEAPMAYKDIQSVMLAQTDLVDVLATFRPKIVRMDEARKGHGEG
jgi:tRNA-splicing ligase RtcB